MPKFYAVKVGQFPGIYTSWKQCKESVDGFKGAVFKKFDILTDAQAFIEGHVQKQAKSKHSLANEIATPPALPTQHLNPSNRCTCVCTCGRYPGIELPLAKSAEVDLYSLAFPNPNKRTAEQLKQVAKKPKLESLLEHYKISGDSPVIYTDGACEANGHRAAKGGIGVYWGPNHPMNVSEPLEGRQTNNRAEIMAAARALNQCKSLGITDVTICTDSRFLINGITQWINKWKRNGWKLATGNDVINKEDFLILDEARQGLNVKWVHVRGHRGIHGNEEADKLARNGVV